VKLVTNDYGCGTSSSILDYGIKDVVVVSESKFNHVFEQEDDLLFIGHDFLFYLWDSEDKIKRWQSISQKHELWLWCFERIDAIIPQWQQKSHYSISLASKFCKRVLACDEDDCDKYSLDWLPQWASKKFYDKKDVVPQDERILFSGQAGGPEYHTRNELLKSILSDPETKERLAITNVKRNLDWNQYVDNFLRHKVVLNPVGIVKALNTRAYEAIYSNRLLLQHTAGNYKRHQDLLKDCPSIFFFQDYEDLKKKIGLIDKLSPSSDHSYTNHSLYARMKSVGVDIK
jgi:hypothetical protein